MIQELLQNKSLLDDTYIYGTADLSGLIDRKYRDFQYGISIGKRLDDGIIDSIYNGPLTRKVQEIRNGLKQIDVESIATKATIPIEKSRCGKCEICVEKCPANAATGELWNIRLHRDHFFDAHKCRDKCGQLAKGRLNIDRRICGICVSVCPIGLRNRVYAG